MKHLAFFTVLIASMAIFTMPAAKADVVVRPQWAAEQVDGQVQWYYYRYNPLPDVIFMELGL